MKLGMPEDSSYNQGMRKKFYLNLMYCHEYTAVKRFPSSFAHEHRDDFAIYPYTVLIQICSDAEL
jgi:hypothetical protein